MWNISKIMNTIQFKNDEKESVFAFPIGKVWFLVNRQNNASIDVKLGASRSTVISFNYDDCNLAGQTAYETLNNIIAII